MVIKFEMDGKPIDLKPNTAVTLQKNSNIFGDPSKIQTSRSFTLQADFTANNMSALEHVELPSKNTDFLRTSKPCKLIADGLPIFNGRAVLLSIESDHYAIAATFGDLTALAAMVADDRTIAELGWPEIWGEWLEDTPFSNYGIYGLIKYNYGVTTDATKTKHSYSVLVDYLLSKINEFYGLNIDCPATHKWLILSKNLNAANSENLKITAWSAGVNVGLVEGTNNTAGAINVHFPTDCSAEFADLSKVKIVTLKVISQIAWIEGYSMILIQDPEGNVVTHYCYNGVTNISLLVGTDIDTGYVFGAIFNHRPNGTSDFLSVEIILTLNDDESFPLSSTISPYVSTRVSDFSKTYCKFPIFGNCDFTALDLLKQTQLLEGLFISQGATATDFNMKSYDVLALRENAQDFSNEFVSLNKTELKFDSWARTNNFSYAKSDDEINSNYNAASFLLSNLQLKETSGFGSIFGTGANESPTRINQYTAKTTTKDNVDTITYELNSLPIIFCKLSSGILEAVPFVDILQQKYLTLIKSLNNLRVCELSLKLSNLQYKAFNVNKMIYIDKIGKYFYPISSDYDCDEGVLKLNAFTLGSLSGDVTIKTIPLSQSALSTASSAASSAANTYALVVNDYVPNSRTITINGTTQDLSTDRSWTIEAGGDVEKAYAVNSTDYNIHYFGTAPIGTLTSATGWTIAKIVQATNGTTTTTHAIGIFDNRETLNYT